MRCKETLAETVQKLVDENADLKAQVRGSGKYERDCDGMAAEIKRLKAIIDDAVEAGVLAPE